MKKKPNKAIDEIHRKLGLVTIHFGTLEFQLRLFVAEIMTGVSGASMPEEAQFQLNLGFLVTSELRFYKLTEMLESLFKHLHSDRDLVAEFEALLKQANQAAGLRDQVAHSQWIALPKELGHLRRIKITARRRKGQPRNLYSTFDTLNAKDISNIAELLRKTAKAISVFRYKSDHWGALEMSIGYSKRKRSKSKRSL